MTGKLPSFLKEIGVMLNLCLTVYLYKIFELLMDENCLIQPSKRVWKMVKSQRKSGNVEMDIEWQPCLSCMVHEKHMFYSILIQVAFGTLGIITMSVNYLFIYFKEYEIASKHPNEP